MAETLTRATRDVSEILAAVDVVTEAFTRETCREVGKKLTCNEVDAMEWLLRAAGKNAMADALMRGHAEDDDVADWHYTGTDGEHEQYIIPTGGIDD